MTTTQTISNDLSNLGNDYNAFLMENPVQENGVPELMAPVGYVQINFQDEPFFASHDAPTGVVTVQQAVVTNLKAFQDANYLIDLIMARLRPHKVSNIWGTGSGPEYVRAKHSEHPTAMRKRSGVSPTAFKAFLKGMREHAANYVAPTPEAEEATEDESEA